MTRKEARECAFTVLFEAGFDETPDPVAHYETAIETRDVANNKFVRDIVVGVREHLDVIDEAIAGYSVNWSKERISKVAIAVLRLACYEMFFREDIPLRVSLNEAIELVKKYDDEKAYSFANGVLNALMHDARAVGEK